MSAPFPHRLIRLGIVTALAILAGCQSTPTTPGPVALNTQSGALPTMERVTTAASRCWFRSNDPAFAAYRLAPELNSFTGRPRLLIVARNAPESRPLAVIQAEGSPARLEAFGPLMSAPLGARIGGDVTRWAAGSENCTG
jgi:hypothetical protein